jgi:hypothetical protein
LEGLRFWHHLAAPLIKIYQKMVGESSIFVPKLALFQLCLTWLRRPARCGGLAGNPTMCDLIVRQGPAGRGQTYLPRRAVGAP